MLYSCQTSMLTSRFGIHAAVDALMDAGFPAIDISCFGHNQFIFADDWQETARELRNRAHGRGEGAMTTTRRFLSPSFPVCSLSVSYWA